jgi:hypothetical protein
MTGLFQHLTDYPAALIGFEAARVAGRDHRQPEMCLATVPMMLMNGHVQHLQHPAANYKHRSQPHRRTKITYEPENSEIGNFVHRLPNILVYDEVHDFQRLTR